MFQQISNHSTSNWQLLLVALNSFHWFFFCINRKIQLQVHCFSRSTECTTSVGRDTFGIPSFFLSISWQLSFTSNNFLWSISAQISSLSNQLENSLFFAVHFSAASDCLERFVQTKPIHVIESSFIKHFSFLSLEPRAFRSNPLFHQFRVLAKKSLFANVNRTLRTRKKVIPRRILFSLSFLFSGLQSFLSVTVKTNIFEQ